MSAAFLRCKESFQTQREGFIIDIGNGVLKPAVLNARRDFLINRITRKLSPIEQAESKPASSVLRGQCFGRRSGESLVDKTAGRRLHFNLIAGAVLDSLKRRDGVMRRDRRATAAKDL